MKKESILLVEHISKNFRLPHDSRKSIKQSFLSFRKNTYETQHVLKDVSFEVHEGEFFGILGRNGSGKSTLLKLIAGIYQPSEGKITLEGTLTPFIELGIGFNPELSGRDNVYLNGAILGLQKKEINDKYEDIVKFAELESFMDQKLRNYSSGMLVRLAFSISIQAHNNILLIDEVLAVGDINFQQKCLNVFREMKKTGKTVVLVTHDMAAVEEFCDRALLIDKGKIVKLGSGKDVANLYRRLNFEQLSDEPQSKKVKRWGNRKVVVEDVSVVNPATGKLSRVYSEDSIRFKIMIRAEQYVENPIVGLQIRNLAGQVIIGTNSKLDGQTIKVMNSGEARMLEWDINNILRSGVYTLTVAVHDLAGEPFDWIEDMQKFTVQRGVDTSAMVDPPRKLIMKEANGRATK